jgi:predicted small integral membrane protein
MQLRYLKILFVLALAVWALVTFIGNLFLIPGTYQSVQRVTSMTGVPRVLPIATRSSLVAWAGVAWIIVGKAVAAACLFVGLDQMWIARDASSAVFNQAKSWALFGGWVTVLWLFVGFALVGEIVFYMFTSERGAKEAQSAIRYAAYFALPLLFIAQAD